MNKIKSLKEEFLNGTNLTSLFSKPVEIKEGIQGSKFIVCKKDGKLFFYTKNINNQINIVDRILVKYLEYPISFFDNIDIELFPENYAFNFEYMFNNFPGHISYSLIPKSKLILTHISILNKSGKILKIIKEYDTIIKWAQKLETDYIPRLFYGKLEDFKIENLKEYLKNSENIINFSEYLFRNVLDIHKLPYMHTSYSDICYLVFDFVKDVYILEDPMLKVRIEEDYNNRKNFENDSYQIFIIDIMNFIQSSGFTDNLKSIDYHSRYIEFINDIFIRYVYSKKDDIINIKFDYKEFIELDEFSINTNNIKNKIVLKLIKDKKLEIIYKIFLTTFRKRKKHRNYIFTDYILTEFNLLIDKIENILKGKPAEFLSFSDYLNK